MTTTPPLSGYKPLSPDDVRDMGDALRVWTRFDLTDEQMLTFLQLPEHADLSREVARYGADTAVRESCLGCISQHLLGRDWPLICESGSYDENAFWDELHAKAAQAGWKVMNDEERAQARAQVFGLPEGGKA